MACSDQKFQADFFNNVAAVAIVLIFAKVIGHRRLEKSSPRRRFWHGFAVVAASVAAGAAVLTTAYRPAGFLWHWIAGVSLLLAGIVFVVEVLHDDVRRPAAKKG